MTILNDNELNQKSLAFLNKILGDGDQFNEMPISVKISEIIEETKIDGNAIAYLLEWLSILGFISINENQEIIVSSKYAALSLAAIRRRLYLKQPVIQNLRQDEQKEYFKTFTLNLEAIRHHSHDDNEAIHSRKIINILIKGVQIRNWKFRDVFLLEYHPGWNQYHLIGLGERGEQDINILVAKTMERKLSMSQKDYEIDNNLHPKVINETNLSYSNGALTQFTVNTFVVKKINLAIESRIEKVRNIRSNTPPHFIWATREEIFQGEIDGFTIMSTAKNVLSRIESSQIPNCAGKIKSYHFSPIFSLSSDLNNRVDLNKAIIYLLIVIGIIVIGFSLPKIINTLNTQIIWLTNLANISQVLGLILALVPAIIGVQKSTAE